MDLILVLYNIRSAHNVGSIFRTADGLGVKKVVLSGYTPRVNDERVLPYLREKLNKQIGKTALGAEDYVDYYSCDDIILELEQLKTEGWMVAGLENNIKDERLIKITDFGAIIRGEMVKVGKRFSEVCSALKTGQKKGMVLVLGEEVSGIDHSIYDIIDVFLEIPMRGKKESFNVAVAAGMAGFYLSVL
ncbi:hypothetical protein IJH29_01795 [Candidatus Saccharibacteria bacterium]|nr:hypothetical protein [Candidatus Saccharibacteria bacterium]